MKSHDFLPGDDVEYRGYSGIQRKGKLHRVVTSVKGNKIGLF